MAGVRVVMEGEGKIGIAADFAILFTSVILCRRPSGSKAIGKRHLQLEGVAVWIPR